RHVIAGRMSGSVLEVHLLHVRTPLRGRLLRWLHGDGAPDAEREAAEKAIAAARALLYEAGVAHAVHIEHGDRAHVITRMAQRLHVHRITLGTARSRSLTRILEDAATSRLLQDARVPVEVVPGGAISPLERFGIAFGMCAAAFALAYAAVD
ncbi:MAG TPA: universal stress protein, partial [Burkholderiales bacterium]|nr:universal stress protein [Burkholderiales bacterium]